MQKKAYTNEVSGRISETHEMQSKSRMEANRAGIGFDKQYYYEQAALAGNRKMKKQNKLHVNRKQEFINTNTYTVTASNDMLLKSNTTSPFDLRGS